MTHYRARAALSHPVFCGLDRAHLGDLIEELAGPWTAQCESALRKRRGGERKRAGPGHRGLPAPATAARGARRAIRGDPPHHHPRHPRDPPAASPSPAAPASACAPWPMSSPMPKPKASSYGSTAPRPRSAAPRPGAPAVRRSSPARETEHRQDHDDRRRLGAFAVVRGRPTRPDARPDRHVHRGHRRAAAAAPTGESEGRRGLPGPGQRLPPAGASTATQAERRGAIGRAVRLA